MIEMADALVIVSILAGLAFVVWLCLKFFKRKPKKKPEQHGTVTEGLGLPLFNTEKKNRLPISNVAVGQIVTTVGPHGRADMKITDIRKEANCLTAKLECQDLIAKVVLDEFYFSRTVAKELKILQSAWRLKDVKHITGQWYSTGASDFKANSTKDPNCAWISDECFKGFLEGPILYDILLKGFSEDLDYYKSLDPQFDANGLYCGYDVPSPATVVDANLEEDDRTALSGGGGFESDTSASYQTKPPSE